MEMCSVGPVLQDKIDCQQEWFHVLWSVCEILVFLSWVWPKLSHLQVMSSICLLVNKVLTNCFDFCDCFRYYCLYQGVIEFLIRDLFVTFLNFLFSISYNNSDSFVSVFKIYLVVGAKSFLSAFVCFVVRLSFMLEKVINEGNLQLCTFQLIF